MRKMLRSIAKARMARKGYTRINRRMSAGWWRRHVNAYPLNVETGARMSIDFCGRAKNNKRQGQFTYSRIGG